MSPAGDKEEQSESAQAVKALFRKYKPDEGIDISKRTGGIQDEAKKIVGFQKIRENIDAYHAYIKKYFNLIQLVEQENIKRGVPSPNNETLLALCSAIKKTNIQKNESIKDFTSRTYRSLPDNLKSEKNEQDIMALLKDLTPPPEINKKRSSQNPQSPILTQQKMPKRRQTVETEVFPEPEQVIERASPPVNKTEPKESKVKKIIETFEKPMLYKRMSTKQLEEVKDIIKGKKSHFVHNPLTELQNTKPTNPPSTSPPRRKSTPK